MAKHSHTASVKTEHDDVDFEVATPGLVPLRTSHWDDAMQMAITQSISRGQTSTIDVIIYGRRGALWWGGDDAVEQYLEDPEASVFERIEVEARSLGRIP
jgi:hypothetical protein